jgi:hypothetical protein
MSTDTDRTTVGTEGWTYGIRGEFPPGARVSTGLEGALPHV